MANPWDRPSANLSAAELLRWGLAACPASIQPAHAQRELLRILAYCLGQSEGDFGAAYRLYQSLDSRCARLLAEPQSVCQAAQQAYVRAVEAWRRGAPLPYILGFADFGGHSFAVGPGVLVPREDSEVLLALCLGTAQRHSWRAVGDTSRRILELCCGTACIALSLYLQLNPDSAGPAEWSVFASDISQQALVYAEQNRCNLLRPGAAFQLLQGDLFAAEGLQGKYHIILANPPYLSQREWRRRSAWDEPELALASGADGLALLRQIAAQSPAYLHPGGTLLLEAAPWQLHELGRLLHRNGFEQLRYSCDNAGWQRVIAARFFG